MDKPARHEDFPKMTLGEHLEELRRRIIYALLGVALALAVALALGRQLIELIEYPYAVAMARAGLKPQLAVLAISGGFTMWATVALYAALVAASPWVFYQLWMFVAAGLHTHERRWIVWAVPFSAALFAGGAAFAVGVSIPAIGFFIEFDKWLPGVTPIITLQDYVHFMAALTATMGLVFQMPLAVLVLAKTGLASMKGFNKYRRHVILAISVFAAVFAPPDLLSMFLMGLPMWALYELGVVLAYFLVLRRASADKSN